MTFLFSINASMVFHSHGWTTLPQLKPISVTWSLKRSNIVNAKRFGKCFRSLLCQAISIFSLNSMTHFRSSKNSRSLIVGLDIKLPRSILVYQRSGFGKRNGSITGREVTKKTRRLSDTFKTIRSKQASPDSMASTDTAHEPGSLLPRVTA